MKILKVIVKLWLLFTFSLAALITSQAHADSAEPGKIMGGVVHAAPSWFKQSFLEIEDDVDEAFEAGKHVILFFQLNGCPYCDRMLTESFEAKPLTSYIQANFDTISINVRGDRDVAFNDEISVTEKELSEILEVRATPAIVFLDENNKTVLRVNGYRAPARFQRELEYVATRTYKNATLAKYLEAKLDKDVYQLRANALFSDITDLSAVSGPLMVVFEDGSCYDCAEFHERILAREDVQQEIKPFTIVRLDADSDKTMIDVDGSKTTPRSMAQKYQMLYRPGVLAFDNGQLIRRTDSLVFPFHFREAMRYVAGGFYKNEDPRSYSRRRTAELLAAGIDIDLGR